MVYNELYDDTVEALGLLTLGSRMKRLGERLQAEVQPILNELDFPVPAAQHPMLAALDRNGALTVGQLAETLGVAQPGVTRTVGQLADLGLVAVATAEGDGRRRLVSLSPAGEDFVVRAKREVWPRVEGAMADLCADFGEDLLGLLSVLETGLARQSLKERADGRRSDDGA